MADYGNFDLEQVRIAAEKNIDAVKNNFSKPFRFSSVDPSKFQHLCLRFYEKCEYRLLGLGFSVIGNVEDISMRKQRPDPKTFIRIMVDNDCTTTAAIYHIKPNAFWSALLYLSGFFHRKIYEFESEFTDGSFITTTILSESKSQIPNANIFSFHYPHKTPIIDLYKLHKRHFQQHIKQVPSREPIQQKTIEDIQLSLNRQIALKNEHFLNNGSLTLEQLQKRTNNKLFAEKVYEEIKNILCSEAVKG